MIGLASTQLLAVILQMDPTTIWLSQEQGNCVKTDLVTQENRLSHARHVCISAPLPASPVKEKFPIPIAHPPPFPSFRVPATGLIIKLPNLIASAARMFFLLGKKI